MMAAASGEPAQTVVGAGPEPGGGSGRTRWEETGDGNIRKPHKHGAQGGAVRIDGASQVRRWPVARGTRSAHRASCQKTRRGSVHASRPCEEQDGPQAREKGAPDGLALHRRGDHGGPPRGRSGFSRCAGSGGWWHRPEARLRCAGGRGPGWSLVRHGPAGMRGSFNESAFVLITSHAMSVPGKSKNNLYNSIISI